MNEMNRIHNSRNPYQGSSKRVLCVCSAGLLRSPTAAKILGEEPYNYNTRAAGAEESYALIPVDRVLINWADEIVCMTAQHRDMLFSKFPELRAGVGPTVEVLNINDDYAYNDPDLRRLIKEAYNKLLNSRAEARDVEQKTTNDNF